jgi:hypothetical protein
MFFENRCGGMPTKRLERRLQRRLRRQAHFDDLIAKYEKLKKEDTAHEEQIKAPDNAIDYHTKDRR